MARLYGKAQACARLSAKGEGAGKPAPDNRLEDALVGMAAAHAGQFGYLVGVDRPDQAMAPYVYGAELL